MRKSILILSFCMVFFVYLNAGVSSQLKYIKTDNTKMYASADARSSVMKNLRQYEEVIILNKQGRFVNIQTADKKRGFVYEFSLVDSAPKKKAGSNILGGLSTDNYASRDSSTRANIRGLTEMSKKYAEENRISELSLQTVINMEKYSVPLNKLEEFMKDGSLGEFAN